MEISKIKKDKAIEEVSLEEEKNQVVIALNKVKFLLSNLALGEKRNEAFRESTLLHYKLMLLDQLIKCGQVDTIRISWQIKQRNNGFFDHVAFNRACFEVWQKATNGAPLEQDTFFALYQELEASSLFTKLMKALFLCREKAHFLFWTTLEKILVRKDRVPGRF